MLGRVDVPELATGSVTEKPINLPGALKRLVIQSRGSTLSLLDCLGPFRMQSKTSLLFYKLKVTIWF